MTRILVVDDEPELEDLVTQKFRRQIREGSIAFGFARDGVEALAMLATDPTFDLVLSDINMPRMDGLALSREMRLAWPMVPLLLISGRPAPSEPRPFLPKPFRWDTLSRAITSLAGPTFGAPQCA